MIRPEDVALEGEAVAERQRRSDPAPTSDEAGLIVEGGGGLLQGVAEGLVGGIGHPVGEAESWRAAVADGGADLGVEVAVEGASEVAAGALSGAAESASGGVFDAAASVAGGALELAGGVAGGALEVAGGVAGAAIEGALEGAGAVLGFVGEALSGIG